MDKSILRKATSDDEVPTSGFIMTQIVPMTQTAQARASLEDFLLSRLQYDSPHVKLKTLRVISHLAIYGHVEFRLSMQRRTESIKKCLSYNGHRDELRGDSLSRAVRTSAETALKEIFTTVENVATYGTRGMSRLHNDSVSSESYAETAPAVKSEKGIANFVRSVANKFSNSSTSINISSETNKAGEVYLPPTDDAKWNDSFGKKKISAFGNVIGEEKREETKDNLQYERKLFEEFLTANTLRTMPTPASLSQLHQSLMHSNKSSAAEVMMQKIIDEEQTPFGTSLLRTLYAVSYFLDTEKNASKSSDSYINLFAPFASSVLSCLRRLRLVNGKLAPKIDEIISIFQAHGLQEAAPPVSPTPPGDIADIFASLTISHSCASATPLNASLQESSLLNQLTDAPKYNERPSLGTSPTATDSRAGSAETTNFDLLSIPTGSNYSLPMERKVDVANIRSDKGRMPSLDLLDLDWTAAKAAPVFAASPIKNESASTSQPLQNKKFDAFDSLFEETRPTPSPSTHQKPFSISLL